MKITLFAWLNLIYKEEVIRTVEHEISLSNRELSKDISDFCGKVYTAIDDMLYELLSINGTIEDTIKLVISPQEYRLGDVIPITIMPSKNARKEINKKLNDIEIKLRKELCHAIIFSHDYQCQHSCCYHATQAENTK
ncbi:MAG: hypothetical protein AAGU32_00200 [Bacillota bacterium]